MLVSIYLPVHHRLQDSMADNAQFTSFMIVKYLALSWSRVFGDIFRLIHCALHMRLRIVWYFFIVRTLIRIYSFLARYLNAKNQWIWFWKPIHNDHSQILSLGHGRLISFIIGLCILSDTCHKLSDGLSNLSNSTVANSIWLIGIYIHNFLSNVLITAIWHIPPLLIMLMCSDLWGWLSQIWRQIDLIRWSPKWHPPII